MQEYADFLAKYKKNFEKAERLFVSCLEKEPTKGLVYHNYGIFLYKYKKDLDKAEINLKKAVHCEDERKPKHVKSYAWFLQHVRKNYTEAEKLMRSIMQK
jgi:Tfp pilus assembly protein PilF